MRHILAALVAIVGLSFLIAGYTAPMRGKAKSESNSVARATVEAWDARMDAKNRAEEQAEEFTNSLNNPNSTLSDSTLIKLGELEDKQRDTVRSAQDKIEDILATESYEQIGVVQYCTGWLLLAIATIPYQLREKSAPTTPSDNPPNPPLS